MNKPIVQSIQDSSTVATLQGSPHKRLTPSCRMRWFHTIVTIHCWRTRSFGKTIEGDNSPRRLDSTLRRKYRPLVWMRIRLVGSRPPHELICCSRDRSYYERSRNVSQVDMVRTHCATSGDPEKSISELIFRRAVALVLLLVAKRLTTVHFFCEIDRILMTHMDISRRRLRGNTMVPRALQITESAISRLSPLEILCDAFELPVMVAFVVPLTAFHAVLSIIPRFRGLDRDKGGCLRVAHVPAGAGRGR
jgi:hypothetical protein